MGSTIVNNEKDDDTDASASPSFNPIDVEADPGQRHGNQNHHHEESQHGTARCPEPFEPGGREAGHGGRIVQIQVVG